MANFLIIVLRIYLVFTLASNLYIIGINLEYANPLWIYHCLLVLAGAISSFLFLNLEDTPSKIPRKWVDISLVIAGVIFFAANVWQSYGDINLWMDEYTQMMNSQKRVFLFAAMEQQPLGGYVFSSLIGELIGFGKLSAKLTGFIPMLVSLLVFQLMFYGGRGFWLFSLILNLFFAFDYDVRYLSLEGRSVGFAVMSMAFCALAFRVYLLKDLKLGRMKALIPFASCMYLFLVSVGMQPVFLLFAFGLSLVALWALNRQKYAQNLFIAASVLTPTVLFAPIQWRIAGLAKEMGKFKGGSSGAFSNWITNFGIENYLSFFHHHDSVKYWAAVIFPLALFYSFRRIRAKHWAFHVIFLALALWIPVFELVFNLTIKWSLQRWYVSCFYVLVSVLALRVISKEARSHWLKIALIGFSIFAYADSETTIRYKNGHTWRENWDGLYSRIVEKNDPDYIYVFGKCNLEKFWCLDFFIGAELYEAGARERQRAQGYWVSWKEHRGDLQDPGFIYDTIHGNGKVKISAVLQSDKSCGEIGLIPDANGVVLECDAWNKFITITTKDRVDLKEKGGEILERMARLQVERSTKFYINSILIWYYFINKQNDRSKFWYDELMEMGSEVEEVRKSHKGRSFLKDLAEMGDGGV